MSNYAPTLAGVVGRLNEARMRLVAQDVLNAALWALTSGLAIFAVLEGLRRLGPGWWQSSFGAQQIPLAVMASALAAAVILAGGLGIAVLRAPSITELARRADQTFGLRERVSTALEVDRRAAGDSPAVVAAMMADALRQSAAINPKTLAAFRLPRSAFLVPLGVIATAVVIALVPLQPASTDHRVQSQLDAGFDTDERAAAAEDIQRVADAIKHEAITRNDAYMQAVANTLEDLGERIALTPDIARRDVAQQLGTLLNYAQIAGSEWKGSAGERIPELIDALQGSIAVPPMGQLADGRTGEAAPDEATTPALDPSADTSLSPAPSLDSLLDELQGNADAQLGPPTLPDATPQIVDNVRAPLGEAAARREVNDNQNVANTRPDEDPGAANAPPPGGDADAISEEPVARQLDFETTSEMVLTGEDTGKGRRLELEVTPDTSFTEITDQSLAANVGGWRRTTEADDARYSIGIDDRDTVSRYLHALLGTAQK